MTCVLRILVLLVGLAGLAGVGGALAQTASSDDALYRAWGGKAGIRAVMDDFVARLPADARIGSFFKDVNRENLATQLTDQLCQQAGGPCVYEGAPMAPVHADMKLGKAEFNALIEVLQQSMAAKGIAFAAQNAMLARLAPMHRQIVTRH